MSDCYHEELSMATGHFIGEVVSRSLDMEHRLLEFCFNYDKFQAKTHAILEEYLAPTKLQVLGDEKRLQTTLESYDLSTYSGSSGAASKGPRHSRTRIMSRLKDLEDANSESLVQFTHTRRYNLREPNCNSQLFQSLLPSLDSSTWSVKWAYKQMVSLKAILGDVTPKCLVQFIYKHKLCDVKSTLLSFRSLDPSLNSFTVKALLSELFRDGSIQRAFKQMVDLKAVLEDVTPECFVQFIYRHKLCDVNSTLLLFQSLVPSLDSFTANLLLSELFQDGSVKRAFKQMVSLKAVLGVVTPESLVQFIYRRKLCDVELTLRFFRSQDPNFDFGCEQNPVSMLLREHHVLGAFQQMTLEKALGCKINSQSLREYILGRQLSSVQSTFQSFQILLPDLENHSGKNIPFIRHLEYCVRRVIQQIILEKLFVHDFYCILVVAFVFEYLMGYVQRGGWATYSDTSWEFRATYVAIELRLAAYFWIKFRAPTQPSSNGPGPSNVVATGTSDLPTPRRKRKAAPGEPSICTKRYPEAGYVKYEPRVQASGKRVSLGEYHTREEAANVFWVAGYYYRYVSAGELPFDATSLPEMPPELSDKDRASWIKTKAKEWAASKSLVPEGRPPALFTGEGCAVRASLTSPTGTSEPPSAQDLQYLEVLLESSPWQATLEVNTGTTEPPSSSVLPGHYQQVVDVYLQESPCQAAQTAPTFERVPQGCGDELGNNTNHPFTSAPEHASTGLVNELAGCSGYLISAPPGARADHSCTLTMWSAFEEFAKQGWEMSFNRRLHTNYFIREPTASHHREGPALVLSPTMISAFTEFQRGGWTVEFLDR